MLDETKEYRGYTYVIAQEEYPWNPRENDNIGVMVCSHKKYKLGDDTDVPFNDFTSWNEVRDYIERKFKPVVMYPLYMYEHGGCYISITDPNDRWDSGQIGFIYTTKAQIRANFGIKRVTAAHITSAEKILESEVEQYSSYVNGDVYNVHVYDEKGEDVECLGEFYETEFAEESAKELIDYCIDKAPKAVDENQLSLDIQS